MKAPSFRCTERPEDGALILHYYSDRPGLEYIVIGIVKVLKTSIYLIKICSSLISLQTVASKLHDTEVAVEILKSKNEANHVQFLITEMSSSRKAQKIEIEEIDTLSLGKCS